MERWSIETGGDLPWNRYRYPAVVVEPLPQNSATMKCLLAIALFTRAAFAPALDSRHLCRIVPGTTYIRDVQRSCELDGGHVVS